VTKFDAVVLCGLLWTGVGAAAIVRQVGRPTAVACDDPWWSYDYGQAWKLDQTMEALRRAVQR